jgi:D-alanyl-lipoteichoic acid acyltransferase DltB (MBOAT superfamily)
MLFNSLTFLYFFILVLTVNYLLPLRMRNGWVLAASFLFYASWSPIYILLLLVTAAIDYVVAQQMGRLPDRASRRPWLIGSMIFSLGSLGFFKYSNMALATAGSLASWLGSSWRPPMLDVILPLGISFYTFETISYGVDVYRGDLQPKKSFFQYLSFLMFFPKLIAGPIVRASELLGQIPAPRVCTSADAEVAINLLLWGFVKKVLLADNFAPVVESVYAAPAEHNRWMCVLAVYGYTMQVYFDFSAYTDIARGCAKLLGYELPLNFNQPYFATSVSDFWRRWHMTLSRWLRDYFYIPMGGNQAGRLANYRNLYLTMLVGGLWHGANWTFVAWGALNGLFLVGEKIWYHVRGTKPKKAADMGRLERFARGLVVFHLIAFTRIFFRSPDFAHASALLRTIASPANTKAEPSFALFLLPVVTVGYLLLATKKQQLFAIRPRGWALFGYAGALVVLLIFGASNAEFIYFQF